MKNGLSVIVCMCVLSVEAVLWIDGTTDRPPLDYCPSNCLSLSCRTHPAQHEEPDHREVACRARAFARFPSCHLRCEHPEGRDQARLPDEQRPGGRGDSRNQADDVRSPAASHALTPCPCRTARKDGFRVHCACAAHLNIKLPVPEYQITCP